MELLENIKKESCILKDELEKNLYCIKAYNYKFDEEFKKVFQFEFSVSTQKNIDIYVHLKGNIYVIESKARIINFIVNKADNKRFIYNSEYLINVIKELNIKYYSVNNDKLDNSLESESSDIEIYELFEQENILTIYKKEVNEKKIQDIFEQRNNINRQIISELSLNAGFYYPENSNDTIDFNIFSKNTTQLKRFFWDSNKNILYLLGPKGSSKSLFLMNFILFCNALKNPTLYINYNILKNLDEKTRKYIFKKEMVYLFFDINKFTSFYKERYHRLIKGSKEDFFHNLKQFIQRLLDIFKNYFDKKIILIIDNFDEDNKNIFSEVEQLIKLVNENSTKIKLIISGKSLFLKKKFVLFLKNNNFTDIIGNQALLLYDVKMENNNTIKSLVAFNYRKITNNEELEKTLLNEEIQYCKRFNFDGLYFSIVNNEQNLELEKLLDYIYIIPFEYLKFLINDDKSIKFEYFNPLFLKAAKKSIESEIKEKSLQYLLKNDNKDYLINGIYEEKLLSTLISYNKLNIDNMKTSENNLFEVSKICQLKFKIFKKTSKKFDNGLTIIINQENFKGELYDLLILIPKKVNEGNFIYSAFMIQIGTNKTGSQIMEIKNDFDDNKNNYLEGIKLFIDNKIKIETIELLFIFDKETQVKLQLNKTWPSIFGSKYCLNNIIKFYCFSYETYKLYKTFDNRNYFAIKKFGDFDKYNTKKDWSNYLLNRFYFLVNEEMEFINSKIINGDLSDYGIYPEKEKTKFPIIINNEEIYVLVGDINKYFIINGEIYSYINDKFEIISKDKVIYNDELFDKFMLFRCKNEEEGLKRTSKKNF